MNLPICKVCQNETRYLFNKMVLNKYSVNYFQCDRCEFIQVEEPYWLPEAYQNVITKLDIGLISRNLVFVNRLAPILNRYARKNKETIFLDYGGGYGLFTRMMRDKGFNFYRQDDYCQNIFAQSFDHTDLINPIKFNVLTAFEVFEHLANPLSDIDRMFEFSENIVFSTELQQKSKPIKDWWYLAPETGQHISFYSIETLKKIAKLKGKRLHSDGKYLHMLSNKQFNIDLTKEPLSSLISKAWNKIKYTSLLHSDYNNIKIKLNNPLD